MAKLYFRYGAMNSGKTTALLQVAFNYKERGMRVVILKASIDTKGGDAIVSRLGVSCKVDHLVRPETDIFALIEADIEANGRPACVLCDESQFFTRPGRAAVFAHGRSGYPGDLLRAAGRLYDARVPGVHKAAGAGALDRRDEDHLRLRPQGDVQRAQGQRTVCVRGRAGRNRHGGRRRI